MQFRNLYIASEALFSLLNGDDMYNTYEEMSNMSTPVWIFSKIYLYIFISLFIYVVLSLFIGLIGETYETLTVSMCSFCCSVILPSLVRNYGEDVPLVIYVIGQKRKLFTHRHLTLHFLSLVSVPTPCHRMILQMHHTTTHIMVTRMNIGVFIV